MPKEQKKQRLGYSPGDDDAFALTFAQPVAARAGHTMVEAAGRGSRSITMTRWTGVRDGKRT